MSTDLYEDRSGNWCRFWHHHHAFCPIVFGSISKRLPIVPSRHGDKVTTTLSAGKLIGHPSDLKGTCQSNVNDDTLTAKVYFVMQRCFDFLTDQFAACFPALCGFGIGC